MKDLDKKFNALWYSFDSIKNVEKAPKTSNVLLYKEHRRVMENWKMELNKVLFDGEKRVVIELDNLFEILVPEYYGEFIDFRKFRRTYLQNTNIHPSRKVYDARYIYYYIYWELLKEEPQIKQFEHLSHPYSLIVDIIKRGGSIYHVEMSFYSISGIEFDRKKVLSQPLPSTERDFLDYVDHCCGNNSANIPDDEDIALLWNEFNGGERSYKKWYPQY